MPFRDIEDAVHILPRNAVGILVFGSRARGDFTKDSDLDMLAMVESSRGSCSRGRVHLSFYTADQLQSASETIFGMHLARDGIVVHDPGEILIDYLQRMGTPDPRALLERARHYSAVIDANAKEDQEYLYGLCRVARYLLRTAIYAKALADGKPCFSVRELAVRFEQPELVTTLSSDPSIHDRPSPAVLSDLKFRLLYLIGAVEQNVYGSLQALIVSEWDSDRRRATLALLATVSPGSTFDYSALPKVLL